MKPGEWAQGKWQQIVGALLGDEFADGKHHPCPNGDGKDCFRFSNVNSRGNYFCRCSDGSKDGFDLVQCAKNTDFAGAIRMIEDVIGELPKDDDMPPQKRTYAQRLWNEAKPSPRSRYLEGRGLIVPESLRWHPEVEYRVDGEVIGKYPAMLAPVTRDGKFLTFHATYLQDGEKAPLDPCRKILPGPSVNGGAVELFPAGKELGIAEGIETAIAAHMLFDVPVWPALNTSLMKAWRPPACVERVLIFADHDENYAGQAAAYALAHRLHGKVEVRVVLPKDFGDWNDELLKRRQAA